MSGVESGDDPFFVQVGPLRDALRALVSVGRDVRQRRGYLPAADGRGMSEFAEAKKYAGGWGAEPIRDAHSSAGVLLFAAEDHIISIGKLFDDDPVPVFSHSVLARSALEASLLASWLMDLKIGPRERIARYMTRDLADKEALERLAAATESAATETRARTRIETIVDEARRHEFRVVTSKKGKVLGIEERHPDTTSLANLYMLDGDAELDESGDDGLGVIMWRLFCGIDHSSFHGLRQSIDDSAGPSELDPGTVRAAFRTASNEVLIVLTTVALAYMPAMGAYVRLMGWKDETEWVEKVRETFAIVHEIFPTPPA